VYDFNRAFQFTVDVPVERIQKLVAILVKSEPPYTAGSSFAITSESAEEGYRRVYLSPSSHKRLIENGLRTTKG
jgi:hypothetical protein